MKTLTTTIIIAVIAFAHALSCWSEHGVLSMWVILAGIFVYLVAFPAVVMLLKDSITSLFKEINHEL